MNIDTRCERILGDKVLMPSYLKAIVLVNLLLSAKMSPSNLERIKRYGHVQWQLQMGTFYLMMKFLMMSMPPTK